MAASIDEILAALRALADALQAEKQAHAESVARAKAVSDLLGDLSGVMTSAEIAGLTQQLRAHEARLEGITKP